MKKIKLDYPNKTLALFGSNWSDPSCYSGSRHSNWSFAPCNSGDYVSFRGVSDHYKTKLPAKEEEN